MRLAAATRLAEAELKYPEYSKPDEEAGPRPDDSASISTVWSAKHRPAIRFHHDRGMSRAALSRIYGRDTVNAVLGTVLS